MNSREIRQLRRKFISVFMASILLAMLFIGLAVNALVYTASLLSVNETLKELIDDAEDISKTEPEPGIPLPEFLTRSYLHKTYFVVIYDQEGKETQFDQHNVPSKGDQAKDPDKIRRYAPKLLKSRDKKKNGYYGGYYFKKKITDENETIIAFLDGSEVIDNVHLLLALTMVPFFFGLIITFFLVRKFSARVIQPEIENAARQRRFITNASHELKTPLAVIRANTEMLELTGGENEWTASTLKQVDHLNGMIQNLVMITRSQEQEDRRELAEIDVAACVNESLDPYEALAAQRGLTIHRNVLEGLRFKADGSKIRQLTTILIDNAIKYCDENGNVTVTLGGRKNGKGLLLVVANDYADGADVDCSRFFDRFYREDQSHNIDKGGYGIGLSIAQSICRQYNGDISASWKNGVIRFVCTLK